MFNNKFEVEKTIVYTTQINEIKKALKSNTKPIHIETPGNSTISINDQEEITDLDQEKRTLLSVDNTFISPYN